MCYLSGIGDCRKRCVYDFSMFSTPNSSSSGVLGIWEFNSFDSFRPQAMNSTQLVKISFPFITVILISTEKRFSHGDAVGYR